MVNLSYVVASAFCEDEDPVESYFYVHFVHFLLINEVCYLTL